MTLLSLSRTLSRRRILRDAAALAMGAFVSAGVTGAAAAADKPKSTQKAVSYQDHPKSGKSCNQCNAFQGPNKCKTVEGYIEARGWCDKFKKT
jgi:hypothetical protein